MSILGIIITLFLLKAGWEVLRGLFEMLFYGIWTVACLIAAVFCGLMTAVIYGFRALARH